MQTRDPDLLYKMTDNLYNLEFFEDWASDMFNLALKNSDDDVAMFEYVKEGLYTGHYFFNSRGKKALTEAKRLLDEAFNYPEVEVIQGFTPLTKLGARWMSRQIGFASHGVILLNEPCEYFILTRSEYLERNK